MILKEDLYQKYIIENKTRQEIADEFGCSYTQVSFYVYKYNLNFRSKTRSSCTRDNFFKFWSRDMAYILGFIITDGYLLADKHRLSFDIKSTDRAILEYIRSTLCPGASIFTFDKPLNGKIFHQCRLTIFSKRIFNDLNNLGITIRKTGKEKFPEHLPTIYYRDFLRGIIDGDGGFYISRDGKSFRFSIYCASEDFLEILNDKMYINGKIKTAQGCFTLNVYNHFQISQIGNYIYDYGGFRLDRKFNKFTTIRDYYERIGT